MQPHVEVRIRTDTDSAYFVGLTSCGSWSACPVCGNKIASRRGEEISRAIDAHRAAGGAVLFMTLTAPHSYGNALKPFYEALSESFSFLRSGAQWAGGKRPGWKDRLGVVGTIRATDCTHGIHGWHPHLHVLFFVRGDVEPRELARFRRWARARWARRLVTKHEIPEPGKRYGVHLEVVRSAEAAGNYVAKLGLGREVSSLHTKYGRGDHRTPHQILAAFARKRRSEDKALWREWTEAMHGKKQVYWSPGLRALLLPEEPELEDAEIAALPDDVDERDLTRADSFHVASIAGETWDRLTIFNSLPLRILETAEEKRGPGLARLIHAALARAPDGPPTWYRDLQADEDRAQQKIRFQRVGSEMRREVRALCGEEMPRFARIRLSRTRSLVIPQPR